MGTRGKSINLFLMDGEANGRIKCTLANWTGIAYKIPRTELDICKERDDLKQSGVYFLFGTSDFIVTVKRSPLCNKKTALRRQCCHFVVCILQL
jgi:hypothetical protein